MEIKIGDIYINNGLVLYRLKNIKKNSFEKNHLELFTKDLLKIYIVQSPRLMFSSFLNINNIIPNKSILIREPIKDDDSYNDLIDISYNEAIKHKSIFRLDYWSILND